jgi:microcystin-dependent protein
MLDVILKSFKRRYITPMNAPTSLISRRILIPDHPQFVAAVNEVLSVLLSVDVWDDTEGGITAQDAAWLCAEMYHEYSRIFFMIGSLVPVIASTIPDHMLLCDGATYSRADYPDLYAVLHSTLIIDADTFKVPDLRQRTVIGTDVYYPFNAEGGAATHTLDVTQIPQHTHSTPIRRNTTSPGSGGFKPIAWNGISVEGTDSSPVTTSTGGGLAHNNMQPYRAFPYAVIAK